MDKILKVKYIVDQLDTIIEELDYSDFLFGSKSMLEEARSKIVDQVASHYAESLDDIQRVLYTEDNIEDKLESIAIIVEEAEETEKWLRANG